MLPPRYVLVGASRWLDLLRTSTKAQAGEILSASPEYADLSLSNYSEAYDWLSDAGLIDQSASPSLTSQRVLEAALADPSSGLGDVGPEGLPSPGFLPAPILDAARWLGVADGVAWQMAISANHKIDLERRQRVGALGEKALAELLGKAGCDVYHGSLESDALGWDIQATYGGVTQNIEVKTTTSLTRARIFLSRNEFEISKVDPNWVLGLVLIDDSGILQRIAHVDAESIADQVPIDKVGSSRWQSCSIDLSQEVLTPGLPLECEHLALNGIVADSVIPMWWPQPMKIAAG